MFKLLVVCLVPLALAAPAERFIESIGLPNLNPFDLTVLKCDVQLLLDLVDNDNTEMACEAECHKLIQEGHIFNFGCPLVCHGLQNLAHYFHETPAPGDANLPCGGAAGTTVQGHNGQGTTPAHP